jgi:hypothetical protein
VLLLQVLRWLLAAHGFEQFLSRKFPASKRCAGSLQLMACCKHLAVAL